MLLPNIPGKESSAGTDSAGRSQMITNAGNLSLENARVE
jgi:hypothetical protein